MAKLTQEEILKIREQHKKDVKCEIYNDHFENAKHYGIQHAQLIIADIPYNLGQNAYASNPQWYNDGDNKNGESKLANSTFFKTDEDFKINNFFDFCTRYLKDEPKEKCVRGKSSKAPAMIVFCAFEQMNMVINEGKKHGLKHSYPLVFIKNFSAQVLKANMKIVNACEYAVVLYRDKLPKFNGGGIWYLIGLCGKKMENLFLKFIQHKSQLNFLNA